MKKNHPSAQINKNYPSYVELYMQLSQLPSAPVTLSTRSVAQQPIPIAKITNSNANTIQHYRSPAFFKTLTMANAEHGKRITKQKKSKHPATQQVKNTTDSVGSSQAHSKQTQEIELNEATVKALNKYGISKHYFSEQTKTLIGLGYTQVQASKIILHPLSHLLLKTLLQQHQQLTQSYTHEQIVAMLSAQQSSIALTKLLTQQENVANQEYTQEQITQQLANLEEHQSTISSSDVFLELWEIENIWPEIKTSQSENHCFDFLNVANETIVPVAPNQENNASSTEIFDRLIEQAQSQNQYNLINEFEIELTRQDAGATFSDNDYFMFFKETSPSDSFEQPSLDSFFLK